MRVAYELLPAGRALVGQMASLGEWARGRRDAPAGDTGTWLSPITRV